MAYHPNNTPPKHIVAMMRESDLSPDLELAFEGKKFYVIVHEWHYVIYKKHGNGVDIHRDDDDMIRIHNSDKETVVKIAKLLDNE